MNYQLIIFAMERKQRYNKFVKYFRDSIICPINKTIYLDPVLASDGLIYERDAIESWLKTSSISPSTGKHINNQLIPCITFKNIITQFLELNPKLKKEQHQISIEHIDNVQKVKKIIEEHRFDRLLQYKNYSLKLLFDDKLVRILMGKANFEIIKYVIDNCFDLHCLYNNGGNIMHSAVCYASLDVIKYLVNKGVEIDISETSSGKKPIHFVCKYRNDDIFKYFSSLNVSLEGDDNRGNHPIHYLLKNGNISKETLIEFIERGINLECSNKKGMYPLHIVCCNVDENVDLVRYLFNKNMNLECTNCEGWKPIHYICKGTNVELIKEIIDKGVDIESSTLDGTRPIHLLAKPETLSIVEYLICKKNVVVTNIIHTSEEEIDNDNDEIDDDNNDNYNENVYVN
ncbi:hypothetical protein QJ856_gp0967 [Tupanvirus deep ocean]|uniref:Uncharacterized protein n=2 Tax=Tupanvirus TaxID=2094720 RepID=A0AC62A7N1_9VIRU|nr:hypothetical protein QJ856_gp0967 [Tupanvirus deep ocean]QKU33790.1 hypothetical protein [Tupanvirus deep ocean]